ncbi:MAG: OmpA family protein, partial [Methylococcaceae bacterium]|nr:OmpA family protein [Methylococcaceae bacterium]
LGAARATSVLHYLASQDLNANRLRAITYGSTKPIADNKTRQGREKNRRVSLIIKVSDKID